MELFVWKNVNRFPDILCARSGASFAIRINFELENSYLKEILYKLKQFKSKLRMVKIP